MACPTVLVMKDKGFLFACTNLLAKQKLCSYLVYLRTIYLEISLGVGRHVPLFLGKTVTVTKCLCYLLVMMSFSLLGDYSRAQLYCLPISQLKILQSKPLEALLRLCKPPLYQALVKQSFLLIPFIMNPDCEIHLILFLFLIASLSWKGEDEPQISISLERGELRMERNQVGGSKEGRDLRNVTPVLLLFEKLLWNIAHAGIINLHSEAQTKLYS